MIGGVQSPLNNATNRSFAVERNPTPPPVCFLSILAEASLERLSTDNKRQRLDTGKTASSINLLECGEALEANEKTGFIHPATDTSRPRSRLSGGEPNSGGGASASGVSERSRSTSPNGTCKSYLCNRCGREYASTDAVRKHARQNHPDWLKEQGQGCPSLYCTAVEATGRPNAATSQGASPPPIDAAPVVHPPPLVLAKAAVPAGPPPVPAILAHLTAKPTTAVVAATTVAAAPVPALSVTAPINNQLDPSPSPADPSAAHLLMTAAESCLALSMAAYNNTPSQEEQYEDEQAMYQRRAEQLAAFMRQPPGATMPVGWMAPGHGGLSAASSSRKRGAEKRPRSVRCGKCDGCERDDCGMCKNCVDKPKFGGIGQRKQGCVRKICRMPRPGA